MVWVATRNGSVRHPVHSSFEGERAKVLRCREHPVWVHECSDEELSMLRECRRCDRIISESAYREELMRQF